VQAEDNKVIVQRFFEALGKGNFEEVGRVIDPGFTYHDTSTRELHGLDDIERLFTNFHRRYPDLSITIEELADAETDRVVARYTMSGTLKFDDKQVASEGMSIGRIHDGKIQEMRVIWYVDGWLLQETERPGTARRCRRWWCLAPEE
jgi:ketosteroid isomerase-like protein